MTPLPCLTMSFLRPNFYNTSTLATATENSPSNLRSTARFLFRCFRQTLLSKHAFRTYIYWKKAFTGLYTKWDSFAPRKYKINLIRTVTNRCFRICSTPSLLQSALKDLRNLLLQNRFPLGIISFTDMKSNDVLKKNRSEPNIPISTVPKIWPYCYPIFILQCRFRRKPGRETP